jgi:antitoxin YefM
MTNRTVPIAEAKAKLSELAVSVEGTHERILVTRNGRPSFVLISADDLESLEETLDLLSDPRAVVEIRESRAAAADGDVFTLDEIRADLVARGALGA